MARVHREIFRKSYEFVVVRPISLTAKCKLKPGQNIDKSKFRLFHLRSLYQRRRIGVRGSPWAAAMLLDLENSTAKPEVNGSAKLTPIHKGRGDWRVPGYDEQFSNQDKAKAFIDSLKT